MRVKNSHIFLLSWQIFYADEVPWLIYYSLVFPVKKIRSGRGGQLRLVAGDGDEMQFWVFSTSSGRHQHQQESHGHWAVTEQLCTEIIRWQQINFSRFMKELRSWSRFAEYLNYTLSAQTRAAATVRWNETYTFSSFHHSSLTCQILKYLHNYTEVDIVVCPVCSGVVQNISPEYSVCMRCLYGLWLVTVFTIMTGV